MAEDAYSTIFSDDPRTGALTAAQLQARRQIAIALATRNRPYPKTIGEGLTALGEGLGEGYFNTQVARGEAAQTAGDAAALRPPSGAVPPPAPSVAPAIPRAPVGRTSMEGDPATQALAMAPPDASVEAAAQDRQPITPAQAAAQPSMSIDEWKQRIARNESGAEKNPYAAVGEQSRRGDFPYGKYQVMGENIPVWTKKYLGQEMTPKEFLADKDAQEQLATAKGNEYITKYGPVGAAQAWFGGENWRKDPRATDALGTHVAEYTRRFGVPLVSRDQIAASAARPIQVASLGGMPTSDTAPDQAPDTAPSPARDAVAQSLVAQQGVQPPPQQVAQAQPLPTAPQMPISPQRFGPQVPAFPAYGDKPQPPQPTPDMTHYYRVAADPYRSEAAQKEALRIYTEMKAAQDLKYQQDYSLWQANELKHRDYIVNLPKAQADLTAVELSNLGKPQTIITGQQGPAPQPQQQAGPDPRLGTDQSPQRSGTPSLPAKPDNVSLEKWSELQAPVQSAAIEAVQKASPQFDDAIKAIQLARTHPGHDSGLGIGGTIARQIPQTDAYAFGKINDQMVGKTFLTAYNTLKGGGQISNVEGDKAQTAQARIDPKQSPRDYDAALNDLEHQLRRDQELAQRKVNMPVTAWQTPEDKAAGRYAPDLGQIGTRGGKQVRYLGGDPADDASYQVLR